MANVRRRAELRRLERAAARLPAIEREVLLLSAGEDLRNEEVAVRLGLTMEAAERHLTNALHRLARDLDRPRRPWWKL